MRHIPLVTDNLVFTCAFNSPLVPPPDQWPVFDSVVMCFFSPRWETRRAPIRDGPRCNTLLSLRTKDPNYIPVLETRSCSSRSRLPPHKRPPSSSNAVTVTSHQSSLIAGSASLRWLPRSNTTRTLRWLSIQTNRGATDAPSTTPHGIVPRT